MAKKSAVPVKKGKKEAAEVAPYTWLRGEIDRLFDDAMQFSPFRHRLFDMPGTRLLRSEFGATRLADICEKNGAYEIEIEVPGMKEQDIEVSLGDETLTVHGEESEEKEEKGKDYYLSERRRGAFTRSFRLPVGIDASKVDAKLENGLLRITLPKSPEVAEKKKKIPVSAAS